MPCAFLRYRHFRVWLGSQFATPGSQYGHQRPLRGPSWVTIWASETPQRPQRPLRGPSWVITWASEAPQRPLLGHNLGLGGLGLILGLGGWRDCGGPSIFPPTQRGGPCQLKKISSAKSDGRQGCLPPSITPFPPRKRLLFGPVKKKTAKLVEVRHLQRPCCRSTFSAASCSFCS